MSDFLSQSDVDASTLKENFITYLQSQDRFKDYNYQGSNLSVLIDILIQNTIYNNFYLNMVGNESFLDSAILRSSVISRAKELNYTPRSRTSARMVTSIEITPNNSPNSIVIPKYYKFTSTINNQQFTFMTNQSYTIQNNGGSYVLDEVTLYEGELVTEYFTCQSSQVDGYTTYQSDFIIQSENIDVSSLEVFVIIDDIEYQFVKADNLFDLNSTSKVFFIQGYRDNQYQIVFGDGVLGHSIPNGSQIKIIYRDTLGSSGNNIKNVTKTTAIDGYSDIIPTVSQISYGGSEREDIDSIKFNAPRHFISQQRAVTEDDYKNLIVTNFPEIEALSVYGGEDEGIYGKVILSLKPYGGNLISDNLKNRIKSYIETKSVTNESLVRDIDYIYLKIDSIVRYNSNKIENNTSQIKSSIISKILEYNKILNYTFKQQIYGSQIIQSINMSDNNIISNFTEFGLSKRVSPRANIETKYDFSFDNILDSKNFPCLKSSMFQYTYNENVIDCWIQDDQQGKINLYTLNASGENLLLNSIGIINYETGRVIFSLKVQGYSGGYIEILVKPVSSDIEVFKNKHILIDGNDINIKMIGQ